MPSEPPGSPEEQSAQSPADEDTLASLALANLTTVLSFGLLAWSGIPALHAIGQVVAPGALLCLVLSAAFIAPARS
jgi:predicted exporter